ncbi:MAG: transglycosylase domain-containing protein [Bacteroidetes bacterium]|nr:transglycosylase domain-containing protein [Bacteroidota bacterium]
MRKVLFFLKFLFIDNWKYPLFICVTFTIGLLIGLPQRQMADLEVPYSEIFYAADDSRTTDLPVILWATRTANVREDDSNKIRRFPMVDSEEIPANLRSCILLREDRTFETNILGINWKGLLRSFVKSSGGGSGIVQQLVKNLYLMPHDGILYNGAKLITLNNLNRKLTELVVGINFNQSLTKDQILLMDLNNVKFTNVADGYFLASQFYFNTKLANLNLAECANLVALGNAPFEKSEAKLEKKKIRYCMIKCYLMD